MTKTPSLAIFLAFLVVALPLGWGLYRSVRNALPLFTAGQSSPATPAQPAK